MNNSLKKSYIPNIITSLNIFCGFLSILMTGNEEFKYAAIFIIAAAIFDTLDGIIARLIGTSSKFGVELDSLSDVVSFGAAPAFLIYKSNLANLGLWGIIVSSLLLIFGALRLARFNIQIEDINVKTDYKGLPIPISAVTIALFVNSYYRNGNIIEPFDKFVIPLVIILSFLMVTKIKYSALPKLKNKNLKEKVILFFILLFTLILALITNGIIFFYIFISVILFGIIRHIYFLIFQHNHESIKIKEETN
ncbi:CDP-diacylglycerol--serine O-phosphatidyltransferase [Melioribacteraceae bacterium 4301-Me]|uniref:CDP-diacylglycerol--serine O-phosphatidyltransferase n=1 Tax=Pyranulibacter aquaticus TaxID=3163344 RepID=UPI0035951D52